MFQLKVYLGVLGYPRGLLALPHQRFGCGVAPVSREAALAPGAWGSLI